MQCTSSLYFALLVMNFNCYQEWTVSSSFEGPVRNAVWKDSRFLEWGWRGDKVVLGILEVVTAMLLVSDLS